MPSSDHSIARRLGRLRFAHLHLIVELARSRSLRASAATLGVTQPALSRTLGELETAFGVALFVRSARGVEPTAAGQVACRGARVLLEEIEHLREEAAHGEHAGALLRVGATPFVTQGHLPVHVAALVAADPPVRVQITEADIPTLVEALVQGRLDAVVCTLDSVVGESSRAPMRYEPLFPADFAVIAHRRHPLTRSRRIGWGVLARQRWILPPPTTRMYSVIEERFIGSGHAMPVASVQVGVPVTVVRMAAAGAGLAVVPAMTLSYLRAQGEVTRLDVFPGVPSAEVGLVSRGGVENPRVALLREALLRAK